MNGISINPYAIYVYCDGAMQYDSRSTGGVGYEIIFPDFVELESIKESIGRYERANIERLELEAILQGMYKIIELFQTEKDKLKNIKIVIFITDRVGLIDSDKTNPYRIRDWRKNSWHNYEGKAIKNSDLLDKIDKTRKKIIDQIHCSMQIKYARRKFNKTANKLAKKGKEQAIVKNHIALKGIKIGKRKYNDIEVDYRLLENKSEYHTHVFKKEPVRDQWEISVEICEGKFQGKTFRIYADSGIESRLHRHHEYMIRIKTVFTHHVDIYKTIKEIKKQNSSRI